MKTIPRTIARYTSLVLLIMPFASTAAHATEPRFEVADDAGGAALFGAGRTANVGSDNDADRRDRSVRDRFDNKARHSALRATLSHTQ